MGIMAILGRLWHWFTNALIIVWASVCFVYDHTAGAVRAVIFGQLVFVAAMIILFIAGHLTGWTWLVVLSLVFTSLILIIYFLATEALIRILAAVANAPIIGPLSKEAGAVLSKLLRPMLATAMTIAWLSAITAIRGVGYYGFSDLFVWGPVLLFAALFAAYSGIKTKFFEYALAASLVFMLVSYHLFPIQVLGVLGWLEAKTIRRSVIASQDAKQDDLVVIAPGTPLYKFSGGGFKKVAKAEEKQEAKIVGRKDDPKSKEALFEVILPDKDTPGLYIGGDTLYVPARMAAPKYVAPVKKPFVPITTARPSFEPVPFGTHTINLAPGEEKGWLKIPDNACWTMSPTRSGRWDLIPFKGEVLVFEPGKKKYVSLPDQDVIFKVKNQENVEMTFILVVKERRG